MHPWIISPGTAISPSTPIVYKTPDAGQRKPFVRGTVEAPRGREFPRANLNEPTQECCSVAICLGQASSLIPIMPEEGVQLGAEDGALLILIEAHEDSENQLAFYAEVEGE